MKDYDEKFEFGPIKGYRKGRTIFIKSEWDEKEHKKFIEKIKRDLPSQESEIRKLIENFHIFVKENFNPLDALALVTTKNLVSSADVPESEFKGIIPAVEFSCSLLLSSPIESYKTGSDMDRIEEVNKKLIDIWNKLRTYYTFETVANENTDGVLKEARFESINSFIHMRGDAYPHHYLGVLSGLFASQEEVFKQLGFSLADYLNLLNEMEKQFDTKVNTTISDFRQLHKEFLDFSDKLTKEGKSAKEILDKYDKIKQSQKERFASIGERLSKIGTKDTFKVEINDKINLKLLDLISCKFGDNEGFSWPLDDTILNTKPVIKVGDEYYCFARHLFGTKGIEILESLITEDPKAVKRYEKARKEFAERKVMELLSKIMPDSQSFRNLHYSIKENGEDKWPEIDSILIYKSFLFLIEAKSHKRHLSGRRGGLERLKSDISKSIDDAYSQSKRALKFIEDSEEAVFEDEHKKSVLKIKKGDFKHIFLINLTLEPFDSFAVNLSYVKKMGFLEGDVFPWSVNIFDLMVIQELIESPDHFIDYLIKRLKINKLPNFSAADELDVFGHYLNEDLIFEKEVQSAEQHTIVGYTEAMDRWFAYKRCDAESAEGPSKKNLRNKPCHCGSGKMYDVCHDIVI